MAKFNINTFDPIYPESNDKKGEVQITNIAQPNEVNADFTEEMRLDFLPIIRTLNNEWAAGRQTIYRIVKSNSDFLLYGDNNALVDQFLNPDDVNTSANVPFREFIRQSARAFQNRLNEWIIEEGYTDSLQITKVHIIGSDIQFSESIDGHIYFHTYDVIYYGQQTPNPFLAPEPTPECLPYTYVESVIYNQNALKVTPTVGLAGEMYATLLSADPSKGTQAVIWQYRGFSSGNPFIAGETYALRVNADPTPAGTTITLTLFMGSYASSPYGITIVLTDAGITNQFYSIVCNPDTPPTGTNTSSLRINAAAQTPQTPTSGSNFNVNIEFQFFTNTCLIS